jgi:hypothetical protein
MQGSPAPPADSVRQVVQRVLAGPEYDWSRPADPLASIWRELARWIEWLGDVRTHHPAAYAAIMVASLVVLAAILAHVGYLLWRTLRRSDMSHAPSQKPQAKALDAGWHMAQSERLRSEGRYPEALAHRFSALLLTLQDRGAVIFRPWKTPAEYVPEARLDDQSRVEFGALVTVLYRHLFGGVPCAAPDLEDFDRRASGVLAYRAAR